MDNKLISFLKTLGTIIIFLLIIKVLLILINHFVRSSKINGEEAIIFLALCILAIFLINPRISIKLLDILEIKGELNDIKKELNDLVVATYSRSEATAKSESNINLLKLDSLNISGDKFISDSEEPTKKIDEI